MLEQAVILVGGLGTRLGALTMDTPKPMLPISGVPFLDYLLRNIARHGFKRILLLAHHHADLVVDAYHDTVILGARVEVLRESSRAGTAGALREARGRLDSRFLLSNGDSLFDMEGLI